MVDQYLSLTESLCPDCLKKLPARHVLSSGDVYLEKECPEHGKFRTVIWRGSPDFSSWRRPKTPAFPSHPLKPALLGCPYDCGLCPDHRQHTCHVLLEVTQRCSLGCPVCYANSGTLAGLDPGLDVITHWFERILETGGPFNIQLSGGEPTLRDDLPEIIRIGRSLGFSYFQVNTNGLRLAAEPDYLAELKQAGLSCVYLQFDGTQDEINEELRGRRLLTIKQKAIENCADLGIGSILVPTLVPQVNTQDIGNIIRFALRYAPAVRGVHFQPVSYFGRFRSYIGDEARLTIPEIIRAISSQSGGLIQENAFRPAGCENALCSFHANFVVMPDGQLVSTTRHQHESNCCSLPEDGAQGAALARNFVERQWVNPTPDCLIPVKQKPSLGMWDLVLERSRSHSFFVSGMAFQDVWNLDLERLRDCCVHVMAPDGYLVPFCAYNLTNTAGQTLYRKTFSGEHGPHTA